MKKNKKVIIPVAILAVLLTTLICLLICNLLKKGPKVEYAPFESILKDFDGKPGDEYTNLNFDGCSFEPVYAVKTDALYSFSTLTKPVDLEKEPIEVANEYYDKIVAFAKKLLGIDISNKEYRFWGGGLIDKSSGPQSPQSEIAFEISPCKTIRMIDYSRADIANNNVILENTYRIDRGDSVTGAKADGIDITLKEAIDLCDDFTEKNMMEYCMGDRFVLQNAYIVKRQDGKSLYIIRYQHSYKGVRLNDMGNAALYEYGSARYNFLQYMVDNEGICSVENQYARAFKEEKPLEDSFVTFDSACRVLSDYLAPYGKYDVSAVSINYVAIDYTDENRPMLEPVFRPMWSFVTKEGEPNGADIDPRMFMCVDMQTADIYVMDPIDSRPWFSINPNKKLEEVGEK